MGDLGGQVLNRKQQDMLHHMAAAPAGGDAMPADETRTNVLDRKLQKAQKRLEHLEELRVREDTRLAIKTRGRIAKVKAEAAKKFERKKVKASKAKENVSNKAERK